MKADNRGVTYRPDFNPTDLLREVYGSEYIAIAYKREQDAKEGERNAKLMVIDSINKCRKLLGETVHVDNTFYMLYDMDLEELQSWERDYDDRAREYALIKQML